MPTKAPCKGCPDRYFDAETHKTCHQSCEKYKVFKAECEERRLKHLQEIKQWEYEHDTKIRLAQRRRRATKGLTKHREEL